MDLMVDIASVVAKVRCSVNGGIVFNLLFVLSCSTGMVYVVRTSIVAPVLTLMHTTISIRDLNES